MPPFPLPTVVLLVLPLFHITGLIHLFLQIIAWPAATVVMLPRWNPSAALQLIEKEKVTIFGGVPTMIQDLLECPEFEKTNLSSLELMTAGGAATPPGQVGRFKAKLPTVDYGQGYGLTETTGGVFGISGPMYMEKTKSTGKQRVHVMGKIVDSQGKEVPPGVKGELVLKGVVVMKEYWKKPEETKKTFITINGDPGWMKTGDIAIFDEEGYLYIVDREKEIIIRGGENISCNEVEGVFSDYPSVLHCCAIPVPEKRLGEVVGLFVVVKENHFLNANDLIAFGKGKLAEFKIPTSDCVFVTTSLPRIGSDKVDRVALKKVVKTLKSNKL